VEVPPSNVIDSAHFGYVYCMALVPSNRDGSDDPVTIADTQVLLVTGSGDETLKVHPTVDSLSWFSRLMYIVRFGNAPALGFSSSIRLSALMEQCCRLSPEAT
jgi:hypothetical protein